MGDKISGVSGTHRREYSILVGKPERKGLLGIRMLRYDHTTKMELKLIGEEGVD
jgi:hypothetical protein